MHINSSCDDDLDGVMSGATTCLFWGEFRFAVLASKRQQAQHNPAQRVQNGADT